MNTFTPRYNVYADKNGVVSHKKTDGGRLLVSAGSPISADEAKRLKIPELETALLEKQKKAGVGNPLAEAKPATLSAADEKLIKEAEASATTNPDGPVANTGKAKS